MSPRSLCPTHFGRFDDVQRQLDELERRLRDWLLFVEERVESGEERDEIAEELRTMGEAEMLAEGTRPEDSRRYDLAGDYPTLADGLIRYVSRRRNQG
jgi:hypothetical protein